VLVALARTIERSKKRTRRFSWLLRLGQLLLCQFEFALQSSNVLRVA
jgi:hypothetical protein